MGLAVPAGFFATFGGFSMLDTSPAIWVDSSDSATLFDDEFAGSLPAADAAVSRIEDKSGNGRHLRRGAAGLKPLRRVASQNGLDTLEMRGNALRSDSFAQLAECTLMVVAKASSWAAPGAYRPIACHGYNGSSTTSGAGFGYLVSGTAVDWLAGEIGSWGNGYASGRAPRAIGPVSSGSNWRLVTITLAASGSTVRINGTAVTRTSVNGTIATTSSVFALGSNTSDTEHWAGNIGELIYAPPITGALLTEAEASLMAKWGLF